MNPLPHPSITMSILDFARGARSNHVATHGPPRPTPEGGTPATPPNRPWATWGTGGGRSPGGSRCAASRRSPSRGLVALLAAALMLPVGAGAQDPDLPRGVQLKLVYETQFRPRLAVQPFTATGSPAAGASGAAVADEVHRIVQRNMDYSNRFDMLFNIPERLRTGTEYGPWNALNVVYLVTGSLEARAEGGFGLRLALHDVVYGSIKEIRQFTLPAMDHRDFRLAVHAASDELVRWATGERGIAATRIAMSRQLGDGTYELLVVDSDGENLRRIHAAEMIYSPAWSPDGTRLAYNEANETGHHRVVERELATGRVRVIAQREGPAQTPTYSPDGRTMVLALWEGNGRMDLYEYDLAQGCCLRRISQRSRIDMNPSFSPDGRRLVFQSDRLGNPHIFTMPAAGGEAALLTPFEPGGPGYFTSPAWSPTGSQVTFHGRSRGGVFQVMVADANRPGAPVQQITSAGRSEDPAWAPDGRHIVFSGVRDDGMGLYIIDVVTGRIRPLVTGGRFRMPDWSPALDDARVLGRQ
jgi:TolB protein